MAAWISADTGVGPAIASGSHTCSGNCADFPIVPPNSRIAAIETKSAEIAGSLIASVTPTMFVVVNPVAAISMMIPNMNGMSPIRVVMNALIAAFEFCFSSYQWPISRYEQTPMTSHPISSSIRLFEITTVSIAAVNIESTK